MGFFDEYKEIGGNFVGAEEKQVLIDNGIPFEVLAVIMDEANKYGPRFVTKVMLPDPATGDEQERAISFPTGTVESRDRMLTQLAEYLDRPDADPVMVKLEKVGRSIIVRAAA